MSYEQSQRVYQGKVNYRDGAWHEGECCQVMRHVHDKVNLMAEHGYTLVVTEGKERWERLA